MESKGLTPLQASIVEEYGLDLKNKADFAFFERMCQLGQEQNLTTIKVEYGKEAPVISLAERGELPQKALR